MIVMMSVLVFLFDLNLTAFLCRLLYAVRGHIIAVLWNAVRASKLTHRKPRNDAKANCMCIRMYINISQIISQLSAFITFLMLFLSLADSFWNDEPIKITHTHKLYAISLKEGLFLYLEMNLSFCFVSKYSRKNFFLNGGVYIVYLAILNKKP